MGQSSIRLQKQQTNFKELNGSSLVYLFSSKRKYHKEAGKDPGPDEFAVGFYHTCWHIIMQDLVEAVSDFFQTGTLLKQVYNIHDKPGESYKSYM
ncbi:hypothetical protein QJS10_CPB04g00778 [Acorus calamus]|uniref:Uncharacterized protein n=1 Tax=Acorus calamus TaxID=4465 RepID=A0AAV9EYG8_ACOCL|nr:hypothetical protein QJS10_CPB04g00778 [Acorus calamus]